MMNPNGDELNNPLPGSTTQPGGQEISASSSRFQDTTDKMSNMAGDAWKQTKVTASNAREKTEFLMRQNPVPTVIGALAVGLAIGLAIRYSSESREVEREVKSPFGDVNLGMLSLPFLWPFFKTMKRRYEDSADVVREGVRDGVDRLRSVDVDSYVKPLRKKWSSWRN